LQHGRELTIAEPSDQHTLAVREFERIVMYMRLVLVDLPKASHWSAPLK